MLDLPCRGQNLKRNWLPVLPLTFPTDITFVLFFLAYRLTVYYLNGVFDQPLVSDEMGHFSRTIAFQKILSFHVTPAILSKAYFHGIWPPLYPIIMGLAMSPSSLADNIEIHQLPVTFGDAVVYARLLNLLFQSVALFVFLHCFTSSGTKFFFVLFFSVCPQIANLGFQIRPENISILLLSFLYYVLVVHNVLLPLGPMGKARARSYAMAGVLTGAMALNHAVLVALAVYVLLLMAIYLPRSSGGLLAAAIIIFPYMGTMRLIHADAHLLSTAAWSNIAYNNNHFLKNDYSNYDDAQARIRTYVESLASGADLIYYRPSIIVPSEMYEAWNRAENERRLYKQYATNYILRNPRGFFIRAFYRVAKGWKSSCAEVYGCLLGRHEARISAICYLTCILLLPILIWQESYYGIRVWSFRFSIACFALMAPAILAHANERIFVAFMTTAVFGVLLRLERAGQSPVRTGSSSGPTVSRVS